MPSPTRVRVAELVCHTRRVNQVEKVKVLFTTIFINYLGLRLQL
jgi:hypothetical protein